MRGFPSGSQQHYFFWIDIINLLAHQYLVFFISNRHKIVPNLDVLPNIMIFRLRLIIKFQISLHLAESSFPICGRLIPKFTT